MTAADTREKRAHTAPDEAAHRELARDQPLEESQKSYHTILEQETSSAEEELARPVTALLLAGLTAGMDVGFGPFAMVVAETRLAGVVPHALLTVLSANLYSIGFIFVVLGHSALFTEHTTSAVLPVLSRRVGIGRLLRLWALVLVANAVGAAIFAALAAYVGPALGVADPHVMGELAGTLVSRPSHVIVVSAILAGWIMGLLSWLVTAARDTTSQVLIVWLCTFVIGLAQLHHSVAGTTEVLMGVFVGEGATLGDFGRFLVWAALGNAIGGTVFVAVLKWGHVRQSTQG